jgi:hypothetical protein
MSVPVQTESQKQLSSQVLQWLKDGAPHTGSIVGFAMDSYSREVNQHCWGTGLACYKIYSSTKEEHDCGTVHCIAGAILAFAARKQKKSYLSLRLRYVYTSSKDFTSYDRTVIIAAKLLCKDWEYQLSMLNYIFTAQVAVDSGPTPQKAAKVFNDWLKTGTANWADELTT